ncbi:MAG: hypothetical protein L6R38_004795 [Xanthoria sp. 2 TBL-2021]|nr:MAG: hypothetical protein L6R38_004795 [Xanthoria sp. 2 TBL-2021]
MGIFKMPRSEWIKIDCNYLERIERRKALLDSHHEFCIGYNEPTRLAVRELYEEVMIKQIPRRFPTIFSIRQNDFTNHVTGCRSSIKIADLKEEYMLEALAENVEEDFYFMSAQLGVDGAIDLAKTYLRCEHTLTCLLKTRTIMFCVRSYLTPIQQVKDDGRGPDLADACDSMPEKFDVYKRRPVWGKQLCDWLRASGGGREEADCL